MSHYKLSFDTQFSSKIAGQEVG